MFDLLHAPSDPLGDPPPPPPPTGPVSEEPGEPIRPAAEDCGGSQEAGQRGGAVQDGEEEAEEKLSGRHAQAAAGEGRDEPVPHQEGEEAHPEGLAHHRR